MRNTSCKMRPPLSSVVLGSWKASVIRPNDVPVTETVLTEVAALPGKKKLMLLKASKASARISKFTRSVILVFLARLKSKITERVNFEIRAEALRSEEHTSELQSHFN